LQILPILCTYGTFHGNHFLALCIWGAHWRHLANTTEPSVCGGDAALCQISLTTCLQAIDIKRSLLVLACDHTYSADVGTAVIWACVTVQQLYFGLSSAADIRLLSSEGVMNA